MLLFCWTSPVCLLRRILDGFPQWNSDDLALAVPFAKQTHSPLGLTWARGYVKMQLGLAATSWLALVRSETGDGNQLFSLDRLACACASRVRFILCSFVSDMINCSILVNDHNESNALGCCWCCCWCWWWWCCLLCLPLLFDRNQTFHFFSALQISLRYFWLLSHTFQFNDFLALSFSPWRGGCCTSSAPTSKWRDRERKEKTATNSNAQLLVCNFIY